MDPIEKAIRSALGKGDAGDRAFREKVYRSAFGALDRAIAGNANMTEAIAARRRQALLTAVTAIETEFVPAKPAAGTPQNTAQQQASFPQIDKPQRAAPSVAAPQRTSPAAQNIAPTLDGEKPRPRSGKLKAAPPSPSAHAQPRPRLRRLFSLLLAVVAIIILLSTLIALWPSGPATGPANRSASGQAGGEAPPRLAEDAAQLDRWIDIFTPADPTSITAPGDSKAEVMQDDEGKFLRITSGASGSPVLFDIGQGILEEIAAGRAVFNITARGAEGQRTQISVDCSLADLGDCGRKRYDVGATREEFLFEMELPAQHPGSGGVLTINPDVEGSGKALDIYAIRVLASK